MTRATRRLARLAPLLPAVLALACGFTPGGAPEPEPEPLVGWQVGTAEHLGLWYHGLASTLGSRDASADGALPRYEPAYPDSITRVKRRLGVYPTPLDQRAAEFGRTFRDDAYRGLEFVPLYFRNSEALFAAIEVWDQAGGDPRRAGSREVAQIIQFLSSLFPRAAQRSAVVEWVELLREEEQAFYGAYWQERLPTLRERAAAVQRVWDDLSPALRDYLDYVQLENGELFLVPALSVEGRLVPTGLAAPRGVIMEPPAERPREAVLAFVHELAYPVVRDAIREYVAPARIRELGEERLLSRAAVRGGAILLEETAPQYIEEYRLLYLRAAGRTPADGEVDHEAGFRAAFPLPADLETGLREAMQLALAGI